MSPSAWNRRNPAFPAWAAAATAVGLPAALTGLGALGHPLRRAGRHAAQVPDLLAANGVALAEALPVTEPPLPFPTHCRPRWR